MVTIKFADNNDIDYPVGHNFKSASTYVGLVAPHFIQLLKEKYDGYSVILWVRGSSGCILGSILADKVHQLGIKIDITNVRKEGENSHAGSTVTYPYSLGNDPKVLHVIIDDFICSGQTIKIINEAIRNKVSKDCNVLIVNHGFTRNIGFTPDYLITS